ncbi:MAG: hypothetical protein M1833_003379 [Piccolia ochrophora]|nr:MAG: hypothetical protein M1833_003379 [Piccolia ochrophora]
MATVLGGVTLENMRAHFEARGSRGAYIRTNREATTSWFDHLRMRLNFQSDDQTLVWIGSMIQTSPENRPGVRELFNMIRESEGGFYGICCVPDDSDTSYQGSICNEETGVITGESYEVTNHEVFKANLLQSGEAARERGFGSVRFPPKSINLPTHGKKRPLDSPVDHPIRAPPAPQSTTDKRELRQDIVHQVNQARSLCSAAGSGDLERVVALLRDNIDVNGEANGSTALHIAAEEGYTEIALALLQHGLLVDARNRAGFTALHCAAWYGREQVVQLLLENVYDIEARCLDVVDLTPLMCAVNGCHDTSARLLLAAGASTVAVTTHNETALHFAVLRDSGSLTNMLLDHGADVGVSSLRGATALHLACEIGSRLVIESLLQFGARWDRRDHSGNTAVDSARKQGNDVLADQIEQHYGENGSRSTNQR